MDLGKHSCGTPYEVVEGSSNYYYCPKCHKKKCPRCNSHLVREFTIHEFGFEHPNNTLCMNCGKRWIDDWSDKTLKNILDDMRRGKG